MSDWLSSLICQLSNGLIQLIICATIGVIIIYFVSKYESSDEGREKERVLQEQIKEYGERNWEDRHFYFITGITALLFAIFLFGNPFNCTKYFYLEIFLYSFSALCLLISLWINEPECYRIGYTEKENSK
jgi:hypothetical protein